MFRSLMTSNKRILPSLIRQPIRYGSGPSEAVGVPTPKPTIVTIHNCTAANVDQVTFVNPAIRRKAFADASENKGHVSGGFWWIPSNPWRVDPAPPNLTDEKYKEMKTKEAGDWKNLSMEDRELIYRLDYGKTKVETEAGFSTTYHEKVFIFTCTMIGLIVPYFVLISISNYYNKKSPSRVDEEWKRASEAYLRENNVNPITGNVRQS